MLYICEWAECQPVALNSPRLGEVGQHETEGGAHSVVVSSEAVTPEEIVGVKLVGDVLRVVHAVEL